VSAGERAVGPDEESDGEDEADSAREPVRELDQRLDPGSEGNDLAVTRRPMASASGARMCRPNERSPEDDQYVERKDSPGEPLKLELRQIPSLAGKLDRKTGLKHTNTEPTSALTDKDPLLR
jgi:hypothetical protein